MDNSLEIGEKMMHWYVLQTKTGGEEKLVEIAVEGNGPYAVGSSLFDIRLQGDIKL